MSFPSHDALEALRARLRAPRRVVITTHHNPDGDALGSSLALAAVLEKLGHRPQVVLPNTPPAFLRWMPGYDRVLTHDREAQASTEAFAQADLVFALDFNRTDRVKDLEGPLTSARDVVLIDHHLDPQAFAHLAFSDPRACSTSRMVFDLLAQLGHEDLIDRDAATCLYAGIMTDTGSFRFSSTTPHTFRVAARLLDRGVRPDDVYIRINDDYSEQRMRLMGFALSERMVVWMPPGVALIPLGRRDLDRFQYRAGDTEGLVNHGLSIRGVRLSVLLLERGDEVKLSFRSVGALPVDRLARMHFDGGGHANAAGGRSKEPLDRVVARLKDLLPAFFEAHPE